jgi:hypothetical protein
MTIEVKQTSHSKIEEKEIKENAASAIKPERR